MWILLKTTRIYIESQKKIDIRYDLIIHKRINQDNNMLAHVRRGKVIIKKMRS
jgi:hypothetical protein